MSLCQHVSDTGRRRGRHACGKGILFCSLHGGRTPASRIAAEHALALARLPACEALLIIIEGWRKDTCPACHLPSLDTNHIRTIISAAKTILDRTGLGPHAILEIARQSDGELDMTHLLPEERAEMVELTARFRDLKSRIKARAAERFIDVLAEPVTLEIGDSA